MGERRTRCFDEALERLPRGIEDFESVLMLINVEKIMELSFNARDVSGSHVQALRNGLLRNGYRCDVGFLSVCVTEIDNKEKAPNDLHPGETLNTDFMKICVCDGRHRLAALRVLAQEYPEWSSFFSRTQTVRVWKRKSWDTYTLTVLETLLLSTFINDVSSTILIPSVRDTIFGAVSMARALKEMSPFLSWSDVTGKRLSTTLSHAGQRKRQVSRYAAIAARLAPSEKAFRAFLKAFDDTGGKLGVVHLNHSLLSMQDDPFCFALRCLVVRINAQISGRFELSSKFFSQTCLIIHTELEQVAKLNDVPLSFMLGMTCPSRSKTSLLAHITQLLGRAAHNHPEQHKLYTKQIYSLMHSCKLNIVRSKSDERRKTSKLTGNNSICDASVSISAASVQENEDTDENQIVETQQKKLRRQYNNNGCRRNSGNTPSKHRYYRITSQRVTKPRHAKETITSKGQCLESDKTVFVTKSLREKEPLVNHSAATDAFDDVIPPSLPYGYEPPPSFKPYDASDVCRRLFSSPALWYSSPSCSYRALLREIYLPLEHRSHVVLSEDDIRRVHHVTHWLATHQSFHKNNPRSIELQNVSKRVHFESTVSEQDKKWAVVVSGMFTATEYFSTNRTKLWHSGFCVLDGMLNDSELPDFALRVHQIYSFTAFDDSSENVALTQKNLDQATERSTKPQNLYSLASHRMQHRFRDLFSFWREAYAAEELSERQKDNNIGGNFYHIINRGDTEDQKEAEKRRGRFSTSRRGVMEVLEQEKSHVCHCKSRALLETRIAMCVRLLDICGSGTECATPKTGGRALRTSVGAHRQLVHADGWTLQGDCNGGMDRRPGVFTIATGKDETPLWVCRGSHWILNSAYSSGYCTKPFGEGLIMEKIVIPPWSLFVGIMDVLHAGAAHDDYGCVIDASWRYHMYFLPSTFTLNDGVELVTNFSPPFHARENNESPIFPEGE